MKLVDMLNGCLDAGDHKGAAACVLAHPASTALSEDSVLRLFDIAFGDVVPNRCDALMIAIAGDAIAGLEALA